MRVGVFCTGTAEVMGLPPALGRLWPSHLFVAVPRRLEPNGRLVPFDALTSTRLRPDQPLGTHAKRLFDAVISELQARRDRIDLAVVVDDLELANADQAAVVVDRVRAFARGWAEPDKTGAKALELRERVSFHLAVPMLEAWFFADPPSLGLAADRAPRLVGDDPERFETDDPAYLEHEVRHCPQGAAWRSAEPTRHPKRYLQWLFRDAPTGCGTTYKESDHGVEALRALDWRRSLARAASMTYLRALIRDLEDALGPSSLVGGGDEALAVSRAAAPRDRVLRNL
ncbi:MAG: hypothetical protein ABMA64_22650 [Myxococcota bacterium]